MTTRATRELLAETLPLAQFFAAEAALKRGAVVKIDQGCYVTITPSWRTRPIEGLLKEAGFTRAGPDCYWMWCFPDHEWELGVRRKSKVR